ncbi:hypothetical protein [Vibrio variabilis]|uniref:hypothetical protein n=1 Tax=Vibrio variabilis TaxID=990271 RepID=UPI000DD62F7A|nr:hypothetical protein [Vibrio variabilis]
MPRNGAGTIAITEFRGASRSSLITSAVNSSGTAIPVNSDGTITYNFCDLDGATISLAAKTIEKATYNVQFASQCSDTGLSTPQPGYAKLFKTIGDKDFYTRSIVVEAGSAESLQLDPASYKIKAYLRGAVQGDKETEKSFTLTEGQVLADTVVFNAGICEPEDGTGAGTGGGDGSSGGGTGG